jgi:hypothetical protein
VFIKGIKMADLIYTKATGLLVWPAKSGKWKAKSGPYGLGALPSGIYTLGRTEITSYTTSIGSAFKDGTGKGFFIPIYPGFTTTRGSTGGRLGIHPDGNVPGTAGCIGITDRDTSSFFNTIKSTPINASITLEVK